MRNRINGEMAGNAADKGEDGVIRHKGSNSRPDNGVRRQYHRAPLPISFPGAFSWKAIDFLTVTNLLILFGERAGARTQDPVIKSHDSLPIMGRHLPTSRYAEGCSFRSCAPAVCRRNKDLLPKPNGDLVRPINLKL